ncbi:hypothetical protein GMRT_11020 [Giardia muris]|uniref:Uncharacterized protein n=1 Tax=Giardia muris TaxID=5742 RepID=A0A4Z1SX19_GIAMU|nr:hypothetical protein GMRT_11020 [Giardia muris]|eukprot:TNJ30090.1 hypothetical protein GMRT_11020 [Giardia muris]
MQTRSLPNPPHARDLSASMGQRDVAEPPGGRPCPKLLVARPVARAVDFELCDSSHRAIDSINPQSQPESGRAPGPPPTARRELRRNSIVPARHAVGAVWPSEPGSGWYGSVLPVLGLVLVRGRVLPPRCTCQAGRRLNHPSSSRWGPTGIRPEDVQSAVTEVVGTPLELPRAPGPRWNGSLRAQQTLTASIPVQLTRRLETERRPAGRGLCWATPVRREAVGGGTLQSSG